MVDGTGFADEWWEESLDTAGLLLGELTKPKNVVCLMTIDDNSYQAQNVLLGPEPLPSSTLKTHGRVREIRNLLKGLKENEKPDSNTRRQGTDMTGARHMLSDYLEKQPNAWLNLFIFSDLVEEHNAQSYASAPQLPANTRVVCLFVDRGDSEAEFLRRKAQWSTEIGRYGVPTSQVSFFDPRESQVGNFPLELLNEYRKPPSNGGAVARLDGDRFAMLLGPDLGRRHCRASADATGAGRMPELLEPADQKG